MKKNLFLFLSIIVLFISCKSDEQKQYDELIESSKTLYEKIKDRPDYLYSSQKYSDSKYLSILDEKMRIVTNGNYFVEKSKIDDRPTNSQKEELFDYLSKIDEIMENNTNTVEKVSNSNNTQSSCIDLSKLNIKYEILEQQYKEVEKFGEKKWEPYMSEKKYYLDSLRTLLYYEGYLDNILYEYNNSLLIRETDYGNPPNIDVKNKFYDESGKLIKEEETFNGKLDRVRKYSYPSVNKVKKVTYDGDGNKIQTDNYNSDKYDKFGNIIMETYFSIYMSDGSRSLYNYEYKYDSNNFWVEKSQKENGKIIYKFKRVIKVR